MAERRARATRRTRSLAAVALVAVLAGCAPSSAAGPTSPTAAVASEADCLAPEVLDELGLTLDPTLAAKASHTPAPTAGLVPGDFVPTTVLECRVGGQMRDSAGTWTAVTATSREGSAADMAAVVAALGSTAATGAGGAGEGSSCSPDDRPLVLWLLDAMDRAVRPATALDGCGGPTPELRATLERLTVTGVVDRPVERVTPAAG